MDLRPDRLCLYKQHADKIPEKISENKMQSLSKVEVSIKVGEGRVTARGATRKWSA